MKKLAGELQSNHKVIDIKAAFNTTAARLFKAWTNEKDFASWFGPEGFESIYCKLDLRIGGNWRIGISSTEGEEYWFEGMYKEIIENKKLAFSFNDGSKHKKADEETMVTIIFSESAGETLMHFNQSVFKTGQLRNNHHSGWSSGFICLRNYLNRSI